MQTVSHLGSKLIKAIRVLYICQDVMIERFEDEGKQYTALLNKIYESFHGTEDAMEDIVESIDAIISKSLGEGETDDTVDVIMNCLVLVVTDCETLLAEAEAISSKLLLQAKKFPDRKILPAQRAIITVVVGFYACVALVTHALNGFTSFVTGFCDAAQALSYITPCSINTVQELKKETEPKLAQLKNATHRIFGALIASQGKMKVSFKLATRPQLIKLKDQSLKVKQLCALGITEIGRAHGLSDNTSDVSDQKDGLSEATMEDDDEEDDKEEDDDDHAESIHQDEDHAEDSLEVVISK